MTDTTDTTANANTDTTTNRDEKLTVAGDDLDDVDVQVNEHHETAAARYDSVDGAVKRASDTDEATVLRIWFVDHHEPGRTSDDNTPQCIADPSDPLAVVLATEDRYTTTGVRYAVTARTASAVKANPGNMP